MEKNFGLDTKAEMYLSRGIYALGFRPGIKGFDFIKYAVAVCFKDRNYLENVTKALYPAVAKRFGTTPSRAERAMRHAIERCWGSSFTCDDIKKSFFFDVEDKPTNTVFIATMVEYLHYGEMQEFVTPSVVSQRMDSAVVPLFELTAE